jgi:hypothetical protein
MHGKTLWQIRNDIAHGNLDLLSEGEKRFISSRLGEIEEIARNYMRKILVDVALNMGAIKEGEDSFFHKPGRPGFVFSQPSYVPGFSCGQYMGPTDMAEAEYYMHIEMLSTSHYRFKID